MKQFFDFFARLLLSQFKSLVFAQEKKIRMWFLISLDGFLDTINVTRFQSG